MRLAAALFLALPLALSAQNAPMADHTKAPVPPSKSLNVTFQGRLTTLKVEGLLALPQVTVHVHNAHRNAEEAYSGPLRSDVLAKAGPTARKDTEPLIPHPAIIATPPAHYFVLYSAAEAEPMFSTSQ